MSDPGVAAEKAAWRERFRALRRSVPPATLAASSRRLCDHLGPWLFARLAEKPGAVALYWPLPGEIDLRALAQALRQRGAEVALPAVLGDRRLAWRRFLGPEALVPGRWALEPSASAPDVAAERLAVVVVPGLAVGRDGTRLGYGGGFYDAALSETTAIRVGVAADAAVVDTVPSEPHDLRLDALATETGVVWVG